MATRSRDGEYPVCVIAIRDGVRPPATITNISPTARYTETQHGQNSTQVASLQDFTSHIGSSGIIVDHQKGLVLSSLLPFSEFLQNEQRQGSGRQSITGSENYQDILNTLSVSVIVQSPKSDRASHSRHSQSISVGSNLRRDKTLVQQVAGLTTDSTVPFGGRWADGDGDVRENGDSEEPLVYGARVTMAWQCHALDDEIRRLLPKEDGWTVDYAEKNDETGSAMCHRGHSGRRQLDNGRGGEGEGEESIDADEAEFVSWFVLLQVDGTLPATKDLRLASDIRAGQPVIACGTPFATLCPSIFLNSLSSGIITKISGPVVGSSPGVGSLVMTDARCMPGMEGGGLFVEDREQSCLAAIIISPLCWKSNELVGLTLACSISALLQSLSREDCSRVCGGGGTGVCDLRDVIEQRSLTSDAAGGICGSRTSDPWRTAIESLSGSVSSDVSPCLGSVVLLRVGTVWGSGVIVNASQGLILTCRHVVKNATMKRVSAKIPSQRWTRAEVVFMTPDLSPVDLAVLRTTDLPKHSSAIRDVPMASACREGSKVYAVGYPLFDPGKTTDPAITSGVVSKVVRLDGHPVMIQSSCAVLPGASGGALLCAERGRLLGIIASNSKDVESGASFPHINFSIPVNCFRGALDDYIKSGDPSCFQRLVTSDPRLAHIWALRERGAYRFTTRSKL